MSNDNTISTDGNTLPTHEDLNNNESFYKGFGAVAGETLEDFHERMYDLEAMIYELEVVVLQNQLT
jgi:hypothetical protein